MRIEFNEEKHVYTVGGKVKPSVTQILKRMGIVDTRFFTEEDAINGTNRHLAIELHEKGTLDYKELDKDIKPYLKQWKKFKRESGFKVLETEKAIFNQIYQYCGKCDVIGKMRGMPFPVVLDIKTGTVPFWANLQVSAYASALPRFHNIMSLGLTPKKYTLYKYNYRESVNQWNAFVSCYNYLKKNVKEE